MFPLIYIHKLPLRDVGLLNVDLYEGLQAYRFFGYFFMLGSLLFLGIALVKIRNLFPYFAIAILFLVGYAMFHKAQSTHARREACLRRGDIIVGRVVEHTRAFNPFASRRSYGLVVRHQDHTTTISHASSALWSSFPLGVDMIGLRQGDQYLFGPEVGVTFKLAAGE